MRKYLISAVVSGVAMVASTGIAFAAPSADLQVQLTGPSTTAISTATTYTVTVKNLGPSTTNNIQALVELPLTNTSPTVYILGTVAGLDSRCSIVNKKISCALDSLKKGKTASFTYTYAAPVSTKTLTMTASVSSSLPDPVSGNNTSSFVPNLTYPSRPLTSAVMDNSHCTGTNLTSYFECALFPSSISTHVATFNADNTITLTEPGYAGTWSQNAAKTTLFFEYTQVSGSGSSAIAQFNGFAINGSNCFDGLTTFIPATTYVSPYRVCVQ